MIVEYYIIVVEVINVEEVVDFSIGIFLMFGLENVSIILKLYVDDYFGFFIY